MATVEAGCIRPGLPGIAWRLCWLHVGCCRWRLTVGTGRGAVAVGQAAAEHRPDLASELRHLSCGAVLHGGGKRPSWRSRGDLDRLDMACTAPGSAQETRRALGVHECLVPVNNGLHRRRADTSAVYQ